MAMSLPLCLLLFLAGCAGDREHFLRISVPEQRMLVYEKGRLVAQYPVSTSKFGLKKQQVGNCASKPMLTYCSFRQEHGKKLSKKVALVVVF